MKLYQIPENKNIKLYIENEVVIFGHLDGLYSYCWLEYDRTKIVHINATADFVKYKDGYKLMEPEMNKEEHTKIVKQLEKKYLGKKTPDNTEIIGIEVDYRKDHQYMNRVFDEYGNRFFINELEKGEENE